MTPQTELDRITRELNEQRPILYRAAFGRLHAIARLLRSQGKKFNARPVVQPDFSANSAGWLQHIAQPTREAKQ